MSSPFHGPRLKIERAKQHIAELEQRLSAFLKTDFYSLRIEKDAETGDSLVKFECTKAIPDEIALVIGDAVHNLRSALDLMASAIVTARTGVRSKHVKFPFGSDETRTDFIGRASGGEINKADPSVFNLIASVVKPYKGGNDAICALHDLDIADKHELLIPVIQVTALRNVDLEGERGNRFSRMTFSVDRVGRVLNAIRAGFELKVTNQGQPAFDIFFDKGLPMEGQPVVPTLHQFMQLVSGIVETFEAHCFGKNV